jgi:hypothetical protein
MKIENNADNTPEERGEKPKKVEEETKKPVKDDPEKFKEEIKLQIEEVENRFQRQIEEQFEVIRNELSVISTTAEKIEGMEDRFQALVEKELNEIKNELSVITASKQRIETELSDKWNIVVKLRSQTYDKLMKEYKKVEEKLLFPRTERLEEKIDIKPQEDEQ